MPFACGIWLEDHFSWSALWWGTLAAVALVLWVIGPARARESAAWLSLGGLALALRLGAESPRVVSQPATFRLQGGRSPD